MNFDIGFYFILFLSMFIEHAKITYGFIFSKRKCDTYAVIIADM